MTRPHTYSKKIRDKRVPFDKRSSGYIGPVRLLKLSKRKKKALALIPHKLKFNEDGKLRKVIII